MTKVEYGQITIVSTGIKTPVLNDDTLVVEDVVVWVSDSATESSAGFSDGSISFTGSSAYGDENDTKLITHYRNIGGTKTKVLEATLSSLGTGEFDINVSTLTTSTVLRYVVRGS